MTYLETPEDSHDLEESDQQPVFNEYHDGGGRVVVGAGAGTGKTTTLIDVVAEAVLEKYHEEDGNPMDDILVTTFTKDAASELKTKLKRRLRQHEQAAGVSLDNNLWRWIETESYIETIDSFTHTLLKEVAVEMGISPAFEIREGLEEEDLYDEIMEELQDDDHIADLIDTLEAAYPDESWRAYPPDNAQTLLEKVHTKSREFCWTIEEAAEELEEALVHTIHQGHEPPLDEEAVQEIIRELTGTNTQPTDQLVEHANDIYETNLEVVEAFGEVLHEFDRLYDEKTVEEGLLSHTDTTYHVWNYLSENPDSEWAESLSDRFDHIFIDEFQDTNYAQCRILCRFIDNTSPRTQVMLIGDVKQSIYQWRSAEPGIFADIIAHADSDEEGPDEFLEADGLEYLPLQTNFRSHPDLVETANYLFESIFTDDTRGDIGRFDVPFEPLNPQRVRFHEEDEQPHLHAINLGDASSKDEWFGREPQRIAESVSGLLNEGQLQVADDDSDIFEDPEPRDPIRGDITLLFQRRTYMQDYAEALRDYGVDCAIDVSEGLFAEPEVRLLIDVLDWFANPHSKDSLIRILRSPVTAISDESLRYLASESFYLSNVLGDDEDWPGELPEQDRDRLDKLVKLRDDLRWERESSKASLIQSIIRHTAFDAIVLGDVNGKQKYANLWLMTEVVNDWEEEELLSYREFLRRLTRLRTRALNDDGDYGVAQIADDDSEETVRLTTVHQSKGLEYSIVILPDMLRPGVAFPHTDRLQLNRQGGALHPVTGEHDPMNQGAGPGNSYIQDDDRGTIWIGQNRDSNTGDLQFPHPLNDYIREELAEFWRTLYVAFTRASDHIIFGSSNETPWPNQYTTWTVAMREYLCPTDGWQRGEHSLPLTWHEDGEVVNRNTTIAVDMIEEGNYVEEEPIGVEEISVGLETDLTHDVVDVTEGFMPRVINPTSLHDLSECPLRFQYRLLQNVSTIRSPTPPGSQPPGTLERDTWGNTAHKALERYVHGESSIEQFLDQYEGEVLDELENVIDNFEGTFVGTSLPSDDSHILPEYELTAYHEPTGTYVRGQIDLLFKGDDGWHIIDYKTGRVAEGDEYVRKTYRYQLASYVWLLKQNFEDVEIAGTHLIYIHPEVSENPVDVDPEMFEDELDRLDRHLDIGEKGLQAKPDPDPDTTDDPDITTRCGTCPYMDRCHAWQD